jgi:hypothetical protein
MASFTVTKVGREASADGSHKHIASVVTDTNVRYTRQQVVDSINAGNTWKSSGGGLTATIKAKSYCPKVNCYAKPYIETNPDSSKLDNLENLPEG